MKSSDFQRLALLNRLAYIGQRPCPPTIARFQAHFTLVKCQTIIRTSRRLECAALLPGDFPFRNIGYTTARSSGSVRPCRAFGGYEVHIQSGYSKAKGVFIEKPVRFAERLSFARFKGVGGNCWCWFGH